MERKNYWQIGIGLTVIAGIALSLWLVFVPVSQSPPASETIAGSQIINATLREFNDRGQLVWEIQAVQAEYRQDRRIADLVSIRGKFYEAGEIIMTASGNTGVINQSSQEIEISGNVKGRVITEKLDISANNLRWNAKQDTLTAQGNITLHQSAQKLRITGELLEGIPSKNQFTLQQNVVATAGELGTQTTSERSQSQVKVKSEQITWDVEAQKIFTNTQISASETDDPRLPEKRTLTANGGEWNTKTQSVDLKGEVIAQDKRMDIEVKTDRLLWNLVEQKVTLPNAFVVISPSRAVSITAQTGTAFFEAERIALQGSVQAELRTDQATVNADRLDWQIPSQIVTATGGIRFARSANNLRVRGDRAIANLDTQTVQVTGSDVITEFTP